jgi:hypothetical protein
MAEKTLTSDQGQNQDQPVDSGIHRAAERIGVDPELTAGGGDAWFSDVLAKATDRVSEMLATIEDPSAGPEATVECFRMLLPELALHLWEARWELHQGGGCVTSAEVKS